MNATLHPVLRLLVPALLSAFAVSSAVAQRYEADWASLDARPVPGWFTDAKFGIFIHWGPYSVPAWTPKGTYSEWYQYWLETKSLYGNGDYSGSEVYDFHAKTYGPDFPYYRFGELFTADLFEPDRWAELFERSGARYVVLTSKHHDGYALWPSEHANDRSFPWNASVVGAKRDLAGDLITAVRARGLRMGYYYSFYEWFHPLWKSDRERFVDEHMIPQLKDLVTRYSPDIIWPDGEWDLESAAWKSPELVAWIYNDAPVPDDVVINDRWGKESRHVHGGFYTTEYDAAEQLGHPWEECRGMGYSFGYNRNEDIEDYASPQALVLMLTDIVSQGGNLLLNIGPDGRGRIPVIMQERLLQIGQWLSINGEAIYGTKPWGPGVQWSEGERTLPKTEKAYTSGDYILRQTVDPIPGYAVKEAFFVQKEGTLFAILPRYPGNQVTLRDLRLRPGADITLLSSGRAIAWMQVGEDIVLDVPPMTQQDAQVPYAFVFRIEGAQ